MEWRPVWIMLIACVLPVYSMGEDLHFWWLKHHGRLVLFSFSSMVNLMSACWLFRCWRNWWSSVVLTKLTWMLNLCWWYGAVWGQLGGGSWWDVVGWWTPGGHHYVVEGSIKIVYLGLFEETRAGDSESFRMQIKITLNWCANGLKQMELLCDLAFNIRNGVSCRCLSLTQL